MTVLFVFMLAYHGVALVVHAAFEPGEPWTDLHFWISAMLGVWALLALLFWTQVRGILTYSRPRSLLSGLRLLSLMVFLLSLLWLLWTLLIATSTARTASVFASSSWTLVLGLLTWTLDLNRWFRRHTNQPQ